MRRRAVRRCRRRSVVLLACAAAVAGGVAGASPHEDPSEGHAVFSGPTQPHASSIYLSPAAMAFAGRGHHLYVGSSLRLDHVGIDRNTVDLDSGALEDGPSMSTTTWSPGLSLAWWRSVLKERAVFGVSLHTPVTERFLPGHESMQYHVLGGFNYSVVLSAAGGFRLADWLIVGLGASLGYSGLDLDFARDTALEAGSDGERGVTSDCGGEPCGAENPAAAEQYQLDVHSGGVGGLFEAENIGVSGGVAIQPKRDWWVTASFVNPPGSLFELDLSGDATVREAPRDGSARHRGRAEVSYRTPNTVWLGVRGPLLEGWDLVTAGRWQNLSRHREYDVRLFGGDFEEAGVPEWYPRYRGMRDTWLLSAGLEGQEIGPMRFGGRLRVESGATDDRTVSPLQIEGLAIGAAGGFEMRLADHMVIQVGYDISWFPTVESTDSAFDPIGRIECVDSEYDFDACREAREGRATPTAAGTYRHLRQAFTLSFRYDTL